MNIYIKVKRFIYVSVIIGLISTNVMSITNAGFHDFLSGLFSNVPITNFMSQSKANQVKTLSKENKQLKKQNSNFKKKEKIQKIKLAKAHKITRNVAIRTAKNVTLNVTSIFGEAVPFLGIGLIVAVTAMDVHNGCAITLGHFTCVAPGRLKRLTNCRIYPWRAVRDRRP